MSVRVMWCCAVMLGIAYLLPNHYAPWMSFHTELAAALAFAPVMVWATFRAHSAPALTRGALAFSVIPLVQLGLGQIYFAGDAWLAWLYLAGFGVAVQAGACTIQEARQRAMPLKVLEGLWAALVVSALVSVIAACHQWLSLGVPGGIYVVEMPPGGRPFGNLGQPNQFATALLLGIAGLVFLFESRTLPAWLATAGALFLVFALVMCGSRSALLSLIWFWIAYGALRKRCGLRTNPATVIGLSVFYVGMAALWTGLNEALLLGQDSGSALVRMETPGMRFEFWKSMLDAAVRAPWGGYGWSQVGVAFDQVALDHPATYGSYDSAHNLLLDLVLQNGIPIGLVSICGLAAWCMWQIRCCKDPLSWAMLMGIGFVFNHAMFEYPLKYAFFLLPVGFFMGALSAAHPSRLDRQFAQAESSNSRWFLGAVAAVALMLSATVAFEYPAWELEWKEMRYDEAGFVNPNLRPPPTPFVLTQISELIRFSRTKAVPGMSESDLEWMRRVSQRYGFPSSLYRYAQALALNGHAAEANTTLRKLCSTSVARACIKAQQSWAALAKDEFPQLAEIPFPKKQ